MYIFKHNYAQWSNVNIYLKEFIYIPLFAILYRIALNASIIHKGHKISGSGVRDNIFPKYCDVHGRINDEDVNNSVSIDGIMSASYREIGK